MSGFQPRTVTIPLYQGDWQQRVDLARNAAMAAEQRWRDAQKRRGRETLLMGEESEADLASDEYRQLAAEHDEVKAKAEAEGALLVTLRALPRKKWSELVKAHPPRTGDDVPEAVRKYDAEYGINDETMGDALVPLSIASLSDPDLSIDDLLDSCSSAQFDLLYGAAFALNRGTGSDPKAAPRLTPSPSSGETEN